MSRLSQEALASLHQASFHDGLGGRELFRKLLQTLYALVLPVASKELLLVEVEQEARWCMHRLKYK